ncbi:MAG: TraB/GumN family protein [Gammaproteobacteria bacterium]|nr:TraB/GumN family protein [Gammaproteobacteria bacterium]
MPETSTQALIGAAILAGLLVVMSGIRAEKTDLTIADDVEYFASDAVATPGLQGISRNYPAMWKLVDQDTEIYLFGTFHLLPPDINWSSAKMLAAMAETSVTYLEADAASASGQREVLSAVQRYGYNSPGVSLTATLGKQRAAKLAEVARRYGVELAVLEPLRPWLATLTLAVKAYQQAGLVSQSGAESTIIQIAQQQQDEIRYLESSVEQIHALASLDEMADYTSFDAELAQFADFSREVLPLMEAWRSGDIATIELKLLTMLRNASPNSFDILFRKRNLNWRRQIKALMDGTGGYFIAVGVGHMVGDDSLIAMLRDDGYRVKRVQ